MALPGNGAVSKISFFIRPPRAFCRCLVRRRSSFGTLSEPKFLSGDRESDEASSPVSTSPSDGDEVHRRSPWKTVSSKDLGINKSMVSEQTRSVLSRLRKRGYAVYLVGGCVRDLILKRTPKDFDIITTANLLEVKKTFSRRCVIVGKRFPICLVNVNNYIVEVSSFNTSGRNSGTYGKYISRSPDCDENDCLRWRNCLGRDFTINGLMFDPYSRLVYDYLGGMEDIKKAKVRTVIPPRTSFQEDCARILRAIRIAARLDFSFTRETAQCIKELAILVMRLDKGRILMEMNYMLAYGSAEASLRLLWKFGLLELLAPIQAAYFVSQGFRRRDSGTNMLLVLFSNLDRLLAPDRPCHTSLWVAICAFHEALACTPRNPLVVSTFSLAVHNGGDIQKAVNFARRITNSHNQNFSELLGSTASHDDKALIDEVVYLASSVILSLRAMTDERIVSQAMARYPQAPMSNMVFIPFQLYLRVCQIFECIKMDVKEQNFFQKLGREINYDRLAQGDLAELRHVFARVVFDTVYLPNKEQDSNSRSST